MKTKWIPIEKFDKQTDDNIEYPVVQSNGLLMLHKAFTINALKNGDNFIAFEDHPIVKPLVKIVLET